MKISLLYLPSYVLFMVIMIITFFPVNLTSHMVSIYLHLNNILSNIHLLVLLQAGGGPFEISRVYHLCNSLLSFQVFSSILLQETLAFLASPDFQFHLLSAGSLRGSGRVLFLEGCP